ERKILERRPQNAARRHLWRKQCADADGVDEIVVDEKRKVGAEVRRAQRNEPAQSRGAGRIVTRGYAERTVSDERDVDAGPHLAQTVDDASDDLRLRGPVG